MFLDAQPQIKDKSAWRKSTLNVANSTEATKEDDFLGRHTLPRTHRTENALHSIDEDKATDRKHLISSLGDHMPTDKLTLYIRKPVEPPAIDRRSNLGNVPRRMRDSQQSIDSISSNKVIRHLNFIKSLLINLFHVINLFSDYRLRLTKTI